VADERYQRGVPVRMSVAVLFVAALFTLPDGAVAVVFWCRPGSG
jgi:hypothetical protein